MSTEPSKRLVTYVRTLLMATGAYTLDQINERAPGLSAELLELVEDDLRTDNPKTNKRTDKERAVEVADYVRMGPGWSDIHDRVLRLLYEARKEERELRVDSSMLGLKDEHELTRALLNFGCDLECGQCASIFYTGTGIYPHTCAMKDHPATITVEAVDEEPTTESSKTMTFVELWRKYNLLQADVRGMRNVLDATPDESNLACALRAHQRMK